MPTIVHFDIAADDMERAKRFYSELFDWKFEKPSGPVEYALIETRTLSGKECSLVHNQFLYSLAEAIDGESKHWKELADHQNSGVIPII